jgi:solute carrier family 45, member 1/2/4
VNISIILIAYAEYFSQIIAKILGAGAETTKSLGIGFAVFGFYVLDFSINAVQACCRSLIVDLSPLDNQNSASAWAGMMVGLGNVFGYFFGFIDLVYAFPAFGDTQLKVLCIITIFILDLTIFINCVHAVEIANTLESPKGSVFEPLLQIYDSWKTLPMPIRKVCNAQFFAWIGWFPFLFYSSSWIGGRFGGSIDAREGSFGLLLFSLISLIAGFVLPIIQRSFAKDRISETWAISLWFFGIVTLISLFIKDAAYPVLAVAIIGVPWGNSLLM